MKIGVLNLFFVAALLSACSEQARKTSELPLEEGTTWVYTYEAYEQAASPSQVVRGTYQLTETVVDVQSTSQGLIAHVERDFQLLTGDPEWMGEFTKEQKEFWYITSNQKIYITRQQPDNSNLNVETLELVYEFPLSVGNSWCLLQLAKGASTCDFVGKREVLSLSSFETQAEILNDCYDLVDYFNTGNYYQTFCNGVGIVHVKFDHPGTRFGFEQTLIDYSSGIQ